MIPRYRYRSERNVAVPPGEEAEPGLAPSLRRGTGAAITVAAVAAARSE